MTKRGDVVIVQFPYADGRRGKNRPALIIQSDRNNGRLEQTIVAMITGNVQRAGKEPTQLLIDPAAPAGATSGLLGPSAVKCENLYTIRQQDIFRKIGHLPRSVMTHVDVCLKKSLGLTT
jgi:mRNA interferase MazF